MLVEKLIDSIVKERLKNNITPEDGIYVLGIRRKSRVSCIRNIFDMAMLIAVDKIEDGKHYFYIDNKKMELFPEVEEKDGKQIVHKPVTMRWDKWYDAFLSTKAIDRVVNNKFKKNIKYIKRGNKFHTLSRLSRILRDRMDDYEFIYIPIDEIGVKVINDNPYTEWVNMSEGM